MIPIIIGICVVISAIILFYVMSEYATTLGTRYHNRFTAEASTNLTEMFIFINPREIWIINLVVLLAVFVGVWLYTQAFVLALIVSVFVGMTPRFIWGKLRERRRMRFLKELPDTLTSVSSMMKAGANLSVAIETAVKESRGPIADEFGLFLRELKVGVEYNKALDNLFTRMPLEELNLVISAMKISREIGGSVADVMYRLADTLRRKIEMEGKIRALTAQGKAQGYVMTGLPLLLTYVLFKMEPRAMNYLFTEWYGWLVCLVFMIFMYVGYFFIKKIVSIDV